MPPSPPLRAIQPPAVSPYMTQGTSLQPRGQSYTCGSPWLLAQSLGAPTRQAILSLISPFPPHNPRDISAAGGRLPHPSPLRLAQTFHLPPLYPLTPSHPSATATRASFLFLPPPLIPHWQSVTCLLCGSHMPCTPSPFSVPPQARQRQTECVARLVHRTPLYFTGSPSPVSFAARTYSMPSASVKASSSFASAPASCGSGEGGEGRRWGGKDQRYWQPINVPAPCGWQMGDTRQGWEGARVLARRHVSERKASSSFASAPASCGRGAGVWVVERS
jgi:hypothetical protein